MARLILHPGTSKARVFVLKEGPNSLGRDAENDVSIDNSTVSGTHAQVSINGATATVADLGSSNGTFIDREPIIEAPLMSGQSLRLGGVEMLFENEDEPIAPAETSFESSSEPSPLHLDEPVHAVVAQIPRISAPPIAPRIPTPVAAKSVSGKSICRFHPKSPARWSCPQCGQLYCELCVNSRRVDDGYGYFCRPCAVQCSPVAVADSADEVDDENFYKQVPGAFLYPFKSDVALVLVCTAVFIMLMGIASNFVCFLGMGMRLFAVGYVFLYMQKIIQYTAQGDEHEPPIPDVTNVVEDVMLPGLQWIGCVLFCFGPAIALAIWQLNGGPVWLVGAIALAMVAGCFYFPMAFLGMAMFDSLAALNPAIVVTAIAKIPLEYLIACVCLAIVFAVNIFGSVGLAYLIPVPLLPGLISNVIGLYFLAVQCRLLGLLYYTNRYRLNWLRH